MGHEQAITVLLGPTASGKSAAGVRLARETGGVIINADALQCYIDLHLLSARPDAAEMGGVEHWHYGVWDARTFGNAKMWQEAVVPMIREAQAAGRHPILLGGTGMYVKGLYEGLAEIPEAPQAIRDAVRALDNAQAWEALQAEDTVMAARLEAGDTQRVKRALEVMRATGRSLAQWQEDPVEAPFAAQQFRFLAMQTEREALYAKIDRRFEQMMNGGAVEEVQHLRGLFSEDEWEEARYPVLKAIGVAEISAYLDGALSREEATELAQRNTRRYAKRQMTWLRGQVSIDEWIAASV